jgi:glycosyltransferase involved in cell wall biosynthesis
VLNISIITPCLNAAATVAHCLDSVSGQIAPPAEHIIIDGGSDDGTLAILDDTLDAVLDKKRKHLQQRISIVSQADKGIYEAMNQGIALANGDVIGILNADDFYPSDKVLHEVLNIFCDPDMDACYGDLLYVNGQNTDKIVRYWQSGNYNPQRFYQGWMPPHPTFFVRRSIYEKYGDFNQDLGSAADYEIMLRFLLRHKIKAVYLPKVLVKMRTGGMSNASLANRLKANLMDRRAWTMNGLRPYPWTLLAKPLRKVGQWFVRP